MGRVGVDLYPNEIETPLAEVRTFNRFVGGFAGNVSTGLARLGVKTAIVSKVGDDGHGEFVRAWLRAEGVDVRFLTTDPYWLTPPTFCEVWPSGHFPLTFYRRPTAPDWQVRPCDFDAEQISRAPLLFASGTALAQEPSRQTTLSALRRHRATSIFDLDWRPTLWDEPGEYPALAAAAAEAATIVVGNEDELEAARVRPSTLVLKRGERGATVYEQGRATDIPGVPVEAVNGLGAGDGFAAALGHGLLAGLSLVDAVRHGTVAGALVASNLACSAAMPRLHELEAALGRGMPSAS